MPPESRLLFYSDGVSEAMNAALEEFGARRIRDHMANPSASVQSLLNGVRAFAKDYPASDDRTLVLISSRT